MNASATRRWWALAALVPAILAVALDATVLSVALPTLAVDLHASTTELQWFVTAYTLVFAAAMVPGGLLGDRFGRKKVLLLSLVIFGAGSLACAFSASPGEFIAARVLLGLGGAIVLPMVLAMVPVLFSEEERPKAVAITMTATMLGFPIGPILGGWLLTNYWWGWVFLMNLPVVVLALIMVSLVLPESHSEQRPRLDPIGILASSAGLAILTYGVIEAGQNSWTDLGALASMIAGVLVLAAFVLWERRVSTPLVDLSLFRSASFTWGTILTAVLSFAMFGMLFALPQYFQAVLGTDAMGSGVRLLPLIGGMLVGVPLADQLAKKAGAKGTVALGFALLAAGLVLGATTSVASGSGFAAAWLALGGFGLGFALPTSMDAAIGALSTERSGVGSAVIQALRMVASSFGAAILGSVLNSAYRGRLDLVGLPASAAGAVQESVVTGVAVAHRLGSASLLDSVHAAFVHGMDVMLWLCAGIAVLGVVLALLFMPRQAAGVEAAGTERAGAQHAGVVPG